MVAAVRMRERMFHRRPEAATPPRVAQASNASKLPSGPRPTSQTSPTSPTSSHSSSTFTPPSFDSMADALGAITIGALKKITEEVNIENPILQCVQIKPMANNNNGQERWRVVFNDTVNFIQGMIAIRKLFVRNLTKRRLTPTQNPTTSSRRERSRRVAFAASRNTKPTMSRTSTSSS